MTVLLIAALAVAAQAQTFEVASIKPNRSAGVGSSIRGSQGRITMENVSLRKVTLWAYGIPDDREYALVGPDWLGTERFDIQATFAVDAQAQQVREMTQKLLAERFRQTVHRESRELPTFALVVAKGGPKIHPAEDGQPGTRSGPGQLEAHRIPMAKLADLLARLVGQPVVDDTGLKGLYDFTLRWSPDETQKLSAPGEGASQSGGPSIFAALQEQLGIKLEGRKGPVDVVIVDRMDKVPTEN